jgi:hypothetical protein
VLPSLLCTVGAETAASAVRAIITNITVRIVFFITAS